MQSIDQRSMRSTELKSVRVKVQHAGKRLTWRADRYVVTGESLKRRDADHQAQAKALV